MPKLDKAKRRDKKRRKAQHGHKTDGKSVFLIQRLQIERAEKIAKNFLFPFVVIYSILPILSAPFQ
jgi:hypothetical protein